MSSSVCLVILALCCFILSVHSEVSDIRCQCKKQLDPKSMEPSYLLTVEWEDYSDSPSFTEYIVISTNAEPTITECLSSIKYFNPGTYSSPYTFNITKSGTYYCSQYDPLCMGEQLFRIPVTCDVPIELPVPTNPKASRQSSVTVITLSVVSGLVLFLAFVGILLIYRRRLLKNQEMALDYEPVTLTDLTEEHYPEEPMTADSQSSVTILAPVYIATQPR